MLLLPENKWDPSQYVAEVIFFLFKIAEAMLDPSVRLYIYQSVCQVSDTNTILFDNCFVAIDIFHVSKTINGRSVMFSKAQRIGELFCKTNHSRLQLIESM